MRVADIADIRENENRQILIEEMGDGFRRRCTLCEADVGERFERALQIVA